MALIACPGCGKKTSSRSSSCPYCQYPLGDDNRERQESYRRQLQINRQQRFMTYNATALLAFCGGAALTFWLGVDVEWQVQLGQLLMAGGLIAYLGVRAWQIFSKR